MVNSGALEGYVVPVLYVTPVVGGYMMKSLKIPKMYFEAVN
jgi:hypothetical protein